MFPETHLHGIDISSGIYGAAQERAIEEDLDIDQALSELARVVKPDGLLLITANSKHSRKELGALKNMAAKSMERGVFTDPNMRFNLEEGIKAVGNHFKNVALVTFDSTITIVDPEPYLEYFDSLREFWNPLPNNEEWRLVMESVRHHIESEIRIKGAFREEAGFGIIIASDSPIPAEIIQNKEDSKH